MRAKIKMKKRMNASHFTAIYSHVYIQVIQGILQNVKRPHMRNIKKQY